MVPRAPQEGLRGAKRRQESAKRGQERHKRAPRATKRRQDASGSDFGAILKDFGSPRDLKNLEKSLKKQYFLRFSRFCKGPLNRGPKPSKKRPPGALNGPQERPGRPQERPKRRQNGPKTRQEHPKSSPRAAREAKKRSKKGHHLRLGSRGGLREASGSHFGSILEAPGSIFRPFSETFRSKLARKQARETLPAPSARRRPRSGRARA